MDDRPTKVYWYRTIYNGYEPDNRIKVEAELVGDSYEAFAIYGYLTFKDGSSIVSITRKEDGTFDWVNDDLKGNSPTFNEAYENMPALVTSPDDYDESKIYEFKD